MQNDFELIKEKLSHFVESKQISGGSIAISIDGKIILENYQGFADISKQRIIDKNTIFRLASMTKPITAAAIMICQDKNLLNFEDEVSKFLPDFKDMFLNVGDGENLIKGKHIIREIKIADLLTHTAGFGGPYESPQFDNIPFKERNLKDNVDKYSHFLLANNPGEIFYYSGVVGFDILARIVEVVSHQKFSVFVKKNIFKPLGMKSASFHFGFRSKKHMAILYKYEDNKLIPVNNQKRTFECIKENEYSGGAGMISNLRDYLKFGEMLTNYGTYAGVRVIKEETVKLFTKPYLDISKTKGVDEYGNWGLGLFVRNKINPKINYNLNPGSFGWSGAYGTHYFSDPSLKLTVVYMHNSATFGGAGAPHTFSLEKDVMHCLNNK